MAKETTLEAALDKIAADNNLTSISVGRMPVGDRMVYTANVHWEGFARSGNSCAGGNSEQSIRHALADAITAAQADRTPLDIVPCELPTMEAA